MKDIILIIEGGGILGVFGAGVLTAFQEANIYNRIKCIYATSAGAHDAAYFLTKQSKLGSSIYFKDFFNLPTPLLLLRLRSATEERNLICVSIFNLPIF